MKLVTIILIGFLLITASIAAPSNEVRPLPRTVREEKLEKKWKGEKEEMKAKEKARIEHQRLETLEKFKKHHVSTNLLDRYDFNKNGKLDPIEWKTMRKEPDKLRAEAEANGKPSALKKHEKKQEPPPAEPK